MSIVTANNMHVLTGTLTLVRTGVWHCDLELDGDKAPAAGDALTIKDGALQFSGTVLRAGVQTERVHLRGIGGKAGLRKQLGPRSYVGCSLKLPLDDIMTATGETLDPTSDADILSQRLDHFTRDTGTGGTALKILLDLVGATWRVQPNGTVWVGVDTYPAQTLSGTVQAIEQDPLLGRFEIAPDSMDLRVGVTYQGHKVSRVEHRIDGGKLRTSYLVEDGAGDDPFDRIVGPLKKLIQQEVARFRYHALYAAEVQGQDAAGLLDLYPDDETIRGTGTSKVPMYLPRPGALRIPVGTRCLMGFENGDTRKPFAVGFQGTALGLAVDGDPSAADFVALSAKVLDELKRLNAAIATAASTETGATGLGGMNALKLALSALLPMWPASVAADKLKAE
jgi:hypothetical protein